jgi:hypothetical protein
MSVSGGGAPLDMLSNILPVDIADEANAEAEVDDLGVDDGVTENMGQRGASEDDDDEEEEEEYIGEDDDEDDEDEYFDDNVKVRHFFFLILWRTQRG